MKNFMDRDFLLETETAKKLYHDYAEQMPIIDYHCHIPAEDIAKNVRFENVTRALLGGGHFGDHYIWRLLRACGYPEDEVTGEAGDRVRFQRLAETMPRCVGSPVYQWLHLELRRYFGVETPLTPATAEEIWNRCNAVLAAPDMTVRKLIDQCNVDVICTTDDPADDLRWHQMIAKEGTFKTRVIPAMRPDKMLNIEKPEFAEYIAKLAAAAGMAINTVEDLKKALDARMDFFAENGCRVTDHGLDYIPWAPAEEREVEKIFEAALRGEAVNDKQAEQYKTAMMIWLGRNYATRGWVMQLHYGARRNCNTRMFGQMGPDTGFDAVADRSNAENLVRYLDCLDQGKQLPKTILYSLNPNDNTMLTTVMSCFQTGYGDRNHVQHGSAWWFNDTKAGMEAQISNLAAESVLGNFVGMLTDSRSFFSYARHEYFRRILCNVIGKWVENGEYPDDMNALGGLVQDICYNNAKAYFGR